MRIREHYKMRTIPYFSIATCLAIFTLILLNIYSDIHWGILPKAYEITISTENELTQAKTENNNQIKLLEKAKEAGTQIIDSGHAAMKTAALYHFTGLSCFILCIIGVFHLNGKKRFLLLSIGLISGFLGIIVM